MIMDWDMPILDGREVMRIVRSPGVFPKPNLPIIMLTDVACSRGSPTAIRLGVHEFLVKPISPKTLQQRLLGIMLNPRPMVRAGKFYIPMPRRRVDLNEFLHVADASAPQSRNQPAPTYRWPLTFRASPVSSRMCMPVLARSTT